MAPRCPLKGAGRRTESSGRNLSPCSRGARWTSQGFTSANFASLAFFLLPSRKISRCSARRLCKRPLRKPSRSLKSVTPTPTRRTWRANTRLSAKRHAAYSSGAHCRTAACLPAPCQKRLSAAASRQTPGHRSGTEKHPERCHGKGDERGPYSRRRFSASVPLLAKLWLSCSVAQHPFASSPHACFLRAWLQRSWPALAAIDGAQSCRAKRPGHPRPLALSGRSARRSPQPLVITSPAAQHVSSC